MKYNKGIKRCIVFFNTANTVLKHLFVILQMCVRVDSPRVSDLCAFIKLTKAWEAKNHSANCTVKEKNQCRIVSVGATEPSVFSAAARH